MRKDDSSGLEQGLFHVARNLLDGHELAVHERLDLEALRQWFNEELEKPLRFNRTKSKGHWRRNSRGIAWFKDTATVHISFMHMMKRIAEEHGFVVHVIVEERIGYVVYEDEHQIIAEPFADTRTGA